MIKIRITVEDCNLKLILFCLLIFSISSQEKKMPVKDSAKTAKPVESVEKDSTKSEKTIDKLREGFKKREQGRFGDKRF
jgi:hypothetical protein